MVYLKINISNFHIALLLWLLHLSVGSAPEMKRNCDDLKDSSCHHHISPATSNKLKCGFLVTDALLSSEIPFQIFKQLDGAVSGKSPAIKIQIGHVLTQC